MHLNDIHERPYAKQHDKNSLNVVVVWGCISSRHAMLSVQSQKKTGGGNFGRPLGGILCKKIPYI